MIVIKILTATVVQSDEDSNSHSVQQIAIAEIMIPIVEKYRRPP